MDEEAEALIRESTIQELPLAHRNMFDTNLAKGRLQNIMHDAKLLKLNRGELSFHCGPEVGW
jgi:hypothetical protein